MAAERRAYIIRVWRTENGRLVGQLSDPAEGWRYPFRNAENLWRMIAGNLPDPHEQSETQPASNSEGDRP